MKRSKLLLVALLVLLLSVVAACDNAHFHDYGEWSITTDPTLESEGIYSQSCSCGTSVERKIPALSDESVWTLIETVEPTHFEDGKKVFESIYGQVTYVLPMIAHTYGDYTIVTEPTLTTVGSATHACECEYVETVEVPVLADTEVWAVSVEDPTHFETGLATYTSIYGTVLVTLDIIPHEYGAYTIVTDPTLDVVGSATHACECGHVETVEVPVLANTEVWAVSVEEPDHANTGLATYTSVYGTVEVVLDVVPHDYSAFTLSVVPTLTEGGSAFHFCNCGHIEYVDVPALSNAEVWAVERTIAPDYNTPGEDTYTSIYGEVKLVVKKLYVPYDSKTYSSFNFDADDDKGGWKNGVIGVEDVWSNATLVLDDAAVGSGTAYPFRGMYKFVLVNAETGEILINKYEPLTEEVWVPDDTSWDPEDGYYQDVPVLDEDGNPVYDWNNPASSTTAWLDMASGLIVAPRNTDFVNLNVYTPFEVGYSEGNAAASAWDNSMAISYSVAGNDYTIFVHNDRAYFGVSFVDMSGNAIAPVNCYKASNVIVLDKDGNKLFSFVHNGKKLVVSDGFEGTYANGEDTLVLNGCGEATLNGASATYVVEDGYLGLFANGEYHEVTISGSTYTSVKPMVTITFDCDGKADVAQLTVNKNVAVELPVPTTSAHIFKGWLNANGEVVDSSFVPTESVTLTANWKQKVIIFLEGVVDGDPVTITVADGDVLGNYLPEYTVDPVTGKSFGGWFLDSGFVNEIATSEIITTDENGITLFAKWNELPAYVGSYTGGEIWNASYGSTSGKSLNIDASGKITGYYTGTVISYDKATQTIIWKKSSSNTEYKMIFDEASGIVAIGYYGQTDLKNDYYIFSKAGKMGTHYGVNTSGYNGRGYYARLLSTTMPDGSTQDIFVHLNRIYSNFEATDVNGNVLTSSNLSGSKSLIVKVNGEIIVSVASIGSSFSNNSTTVDLDQYIGTYVNGEETVVLDGMGGIVYGDKEGSYEEVEGQTYFDVYFENPDEYYQLTLNGDSFAIVKPMVNLTLVNSAVGTSDTIEINANIPYVLPALNHEGLIFNGWFLDEACLTPANGEVTLTEDASVYTLWKAKKVVTVVYNNGEENGEFIYSQGDVVEIEDPKKTKMAFAGWFTTATFDVGSEWANGSAIEEDFTIYAKWEEAPIYYNTYMFTRIEMNNWKQGTSDMYTYNSATWVVEPNGVGKSNGNPLGSGERSIVNFNAETGYFEVEGSYTDYYGYVDNATGIMILNYTSTSGLKKVLLATPFESGSSITSRISSSYWNEGISRTIEYTFEDTVYSIFVHGETVYFGATFKDANGNAVAGKECYNHKDGPLFVYDANGAVIAKYLHDGAMMQELDGWEGTYAVDGGEVVVNGIGNITIGGVEGEYTKTEDGASYTHDAYVGGSYYEVTLVKDGYTAVVNKPMVTITYSTDGKADIAPASENKNIAIVLPVPENVDYIFRAWYFDAELTQEVPENFVPTADVTVYAKWAQKVTLTVVYGNGLDTVVLNYAVGDTVAPEQLSNNGLYFGGWFLDAELTQAYEVGEITESFTIYCKWIEKAPYTFKAEGSYTFEYKDGVWVTNNQSVSSSIAAVRLTANVDITVTFDWEVSSESGWDKFYVYKNGSDVVYAKSGSTKGSQTITIEAGQDIYIYYKKDGSGNSGSDCVWLRNLCVNGNPVTDYVA